MPGKRPDSPKVETAATIPRKMHSDSEELQDLMKRSSITVTIKRDNQITFGWESWFMMFSSR